MEDKAVSKQHAIGGYFAVGWGKIQAQMRMVSAINSINSLRFSPPPCVFWAHAKQKAVKKKELRVNKRNKNKILILNELKEIKPKPTRSMYRRTKAKAQAK